MKIISVVGTRPNLIKESMVFEEFSNKGINEILVHTGQHYDYVMSQAFFDDFNIMKPDYFLNISGQSPISFLAKSIESFEKVVIKEKPNAIMSYGDVLSTTTAALVSSISNIPFIHVEGGIRSPELYNPEEINRRIADHLAKLIFCCTKNDLKKLEKENFSSDRYILSGDLMYDALKRQIDKNNIVPKRQDYNVLTLHRQENVENEERLLAIINAIIESDKYFHFPVHPRTKNSLEKFNLWDKIKDYKKIQLLEPLSYSKFVNLVSYCDKVITDSGGLRREAYLLGKPCIVPINIIWFQDLVDSGWMTIVDNDQNKLIDKIINFNKEGKREEFFGNGEAYKVIVNEILKCLN